jgi:predicted ATP-dependent endonuclease of OLD family
MHPQMQEQFIKNINDVVSSLLIGGGKNVNSQIIITTHSSHILNSKIHTGNTFDNINYITNNNGKSRVVCLDDEKVSGISKVTEAKAKNKKEKEKSDNLNFLKKHIKYKVSELFFADAVIFVEGVTEYTLLNYYLDKNEELNKYYISIILIDGAHSKVYKKLIEVLGIPVLILTDIDFEREELEKREGDNAVFLQMTKDTLEARKTTNDTFNFFLETDEIKKIIEKEYVQKNNLMISYQREPINGYYATSFEEAFILTNCENNILLETLEKIIPRIYKDILKTGNIVDNSFKLQCKLSEKKSQFANMILYKILTENSDDESNHKPELPKYILDGLEFLKLKLGGNDGL